MYDQGLAFFKFSVADLGCHKDVGVKDFSALLDAGFFTLNPIIYEDFLPVSAAGIFQSTLGDVENPNQHEASSRGKFEDALGMSVTDE